jgi:methylmalonyl-CoA mutase C-terminal domain/subunit
MTLFPAVVQELKRRKATDIVVFGGGIISNDDIAALKKQGVEKLFTPGTPLQDIVDWLRKRFPEETRGSSSPSARRDDCSRDLVVDRL